MAGILRIFTQDFAITDDRIEWRAEFMAHVRQELALGLIRGVCQNLGLFKFCRALLHRIKQCAQAMPRIRKSLGQHLVFRRTTDLSGQVAGPQVAFAQRDEITSKRCERSRHRLGGGDAGEDADSEGGNNDKA